LQIDAPSSTITLVDPRVSRDGVPLCPHHADATTPPMGWTMNDLRSQDRPLAPVAPIAPSADVAPITTAKRSRSKPQFEGSEGAESEAEDGAVPAAEADAARSEGEAQSLSFPVSRDVPSMPVTASNGTGASSGSAGAAAASSPASGETGADGTRKPARGRSRGRARLNASTPVTGPASRPSKRREAAEVEEVEELEPEDDKFPWHHQFDDDGPEELKANTPLLSRAFRSSVG
jgi:hypothetical protein